MADEEADDLLASMSPEIADLMQRMMAPATLTWEMARGFRDEIVAFNKTAKTEQEHVALLFAFKSLMDNAEDLELLGDDTRERLKGVREADYRFMLMVEASINDLVDPDRIDHVTKREVEAGRMAADSDFRQLAADAGSVMGKQGIQSKRQGWLGRFFSRR